MAKLGFTDAKDARWNMASLENALLDGNWKILSGRNLFLTPLLNRVKVDRGCMDGSRQRCSASGTLGLCRAGFT